MSAPYIYIYMYVWNLIKSGHCLVFFFYVNPSTMTLETVKQNPLGGSKVIIYLQQKAMWLITSQLLLKNQYCL